MNGISSKSAGTLENKKQKFQGQEFTNDFDISMYEFKFRMHDCQTGRFWQVDPLADKYVYNSTYAFSENKVTGHVELEGLEAVLIINKPQVVQKITTALKNNNTEEAKRLAWVAVSKKDATFTPDQNKVQNPGFNVFDKAGNGLLGESDRERILNSPKDPWVKGGVEKTVLNDLKSDLLEVTKSVDGLKSKINEYTELRDAINNSQADDMSPDAGFDLGKLGSNYVLGTEIEKVGKKLEPLLVVQKNLQEASDKLNKQNTAAEEKTKGVIKY